VRSPESLVGVGAESVDETNAFLLNCFQERDEIFGAEVVFVGGECNPILFGTIAAPECAVAVTLATEELAGHFELIERNEL
jgi:hypothetical protein